MLSVSYAGKNTYSAGKTSGVFRGGASGAKRGYVVAHCGGGGGGGGRGSYEQFSTKKRRRNTGNCKKKYHSNTHFDTYFSKFNIGLKQDTNLTACSGYKLNKLAHLFLEMEISTPF